MYKFAQIIKIKYCLLYLTTYDTEKYNKSLTLKDKYLFYFRTEYLGYH